MKVIAVILSFYFLALNFVPCSDVNSNSNSNNVQTEFIASSNFDHDHNVADFCSPFCNCHCCHGHSVDFGINVFDLLLPEFTSEQFSHTDNISQNYLHSILQPPRV